MVSIHTFIVGSAKSLHKDSYYTLSPRFWKTLHEAGITQRILQPTEYRILRGKYGIYLTDIVDRKKHIVPKDKMIEPHMLGDGFQTLLGKIRVHRPKRIALVGKNAGTWFLFRIDGLPLQKSSGKEHKKVRRTLNYGFLRKWRGIDCHLLTNTHRQWNEEIRLDFWKLCREDASAFAIRVEWAGSACVD